MYSALTRNINVTVKPFYLADRSDPDESRYVWGYRVTIDNQSDERVKLIVALLAHHRRRRAGRGGARRRAWSANSRNSIRATATSTRRAARSRRRPASWSAATRCERRRGEEFDIDIPAFSLDLPGKPRTVN